MSFFSPGLVPANTARSAIDAPVPTKLVATADAAVYAARSLPYVPSPCTALKPVLEFWALA